MKFEDGRTGSVSATLTIVEAKLHLAAACRGQFPLNTRTSGEVILRHQEHQSAFRRRRKPDRYLVQCQRARNPAPSSAPAAPGKELHALTASTASIHRPEGSITFRGQTFQSYEQPPGGRDGRVRTSRNLALFKGMSVIDNIMTVRNLKIKATSSYRPCASAPAQREEMQHREFVEHVIDFLSKSRLYRKTPVGSSHGLQSAWTWAAHQPWNLRFCCWTSHGRHERGKKSRTCAASSSM